MEKLTNRHSNYATMIRHAEPNWNEAEKLKLSSLHVTVENTNHLKDQHNRFFHHFCTTSYLGLDYHQALLEGAIEAIKNSHTLRVANSRNRCKLRLLADYEQDFSELLNTHCHITLSCSAASSGILPLLAAGVFTGGNVPTMVFDKHAHYSMGHIKAACADATEVLTLEHNNMTQLEDICKSRNLVAYVADGIYSMGGLSDIESLIYLKEKYGLFLYLDDSHGLTALGANGAGYVKPQMGDLDERTIIVASLGKAFGAGGGLAMLGIERYKNLIYRYGGPSNWSQSLNSAAIGAGRASISLHHNGVVAQLQKRLQENILYFDGLIKTEQMGSCSPIRLIRCTSASVASSISAKLANSGFFTSTVFFPVVAKGKPAIRITIRADMDSLLIKDFCAKLSQICATMNLELPA